MHRIIGVGGIFFKAKDPERVYQWYEKQLGLKRDPDEKAVVILAEGKGLTVFSIFPANTKCFNPSASEPK